MKVNSLELRMEAEAGREKKMKVVYVAGAFDSPDGCWGRTLNCRKAEHLALEVWQAGLVAICPHLNTRNFTGACEREVWIKGDLEILRRCDAVLLVPGFENSQGTLAEVKEAQRLEIPIFYTVDDLF